MLVVEKLVVSEKLLFLGRMQQVQEHLEALEELLLTSAPSAVVDVSARHDPELAAALLALAESNADVLDRIAPLLEQPRDVVGVRDIIAAMRAGADEVGSLVEACR